MCRCRCSGAVVQWFSEERRVKPHPYPHWALGIVQGHLAPTKQKTENRKQKQKTENKNRKKAENRKQRTENSKLDSGLWAGIIKRPFLCPLSCFCFLSLVSVLLCSWRDPGCLTGPLRGRIVIQPPMKLVFIFVFETFRSLGLVNWDLALAMLSGA